MKVVGSTLSPIVQKFKKVFDSCEKTSYDNSSKQTTTYGIYQERPRDRPYDVRQPPAQAGKVPIPTE